MWAMSCRAVIDKNLLRAQELLAVPGQYRLEYHIFRLSGSLFRKGGFVWPKEDYELSHLIQKIQKEKGRVVPSCPPSMVTWLMAPCRGQKSSR